MNAIGVGGTVSFVGTVNIGVMDEVQSEPVFKINV